MPLHPLAVAREDPISFGHVIRPHRPHDDEVRFSHVRHANSFHQALIAANEAVSRLSRLVKPSPASGSRRVRRGPGAQFRNWSLARFACLTGGSDPTDSLRARQTGDARGVVEVGSSPVAN